MPPDATDLPCPGRASPVRPVAVVPVCQSCPLWRRFAEMGPHVPPVAQHDGERWRCDRRDELQAAGDAGPAAMVVSSWRALGAAVSSRVFFIAAAIHPVLGPGVATRRGFFSSEGAH